MSGFDYTCDQCGINIGRRYWLCIECMGFLCKGCKGAKAPWVCTKCLAKLEKERKSPPVVNRRA